MLTHKQVAIPSLVRLKRGALDRLGIYARRHNFQRVLVLHSQDLNPDLLHRLCAGFQREHVEAAEVVPVSSPSFEQAEALFKRLPTGVDAIVGFGGGKALDVAKYVSFLARIYYIATPTSLSNDGFCSPQSSLTVEGQRRSLPSAMPFGVVLDTEVCLNAPEVLWQSGVGDLVAKFTAVTDWKLAFHARATALDDFAALLSDASVFQFIARPIRDLEGVSLLGTALMLNGIAMAICSSSRPASGSEHLISHALDRVSAHPALHGLQVGIASYIASRLQGRHTETITHLFDATGFWRAIAAAPFSRSEWLEAVRLAPSIKPNFYTILSERDCVAEVETILRNDERLRPCFRA
ncbi:MAG TPA: iron-containing alcohol dehydrogenase family protein [Verrucomicrobiae bacterium]|nr:iron-containing alcohol dehydrogenase family protein [Verrucomicrobiae bacterium]